MPTHKKKKDSQIQILIKMPIDLWYVQNNNIPPSYLCDFNCKSNQTWNFEGCIKSWTFKTYPNFFIDGFPVIYDGGKNLLSWFKNRIHFLCDLTNLPKYEIADGIIVKDETYNMPIKDSAAVINKCYVHYVHVNCM